MTDLVIIGVDCATLDEKTGLALASFEAGRVLVRKTTLCSRGQGAAKTAAGWLSDAGDRRVLLALDAPLGWPEPLARVLATHQAGEPLNEKRDAMFRRGTDKFVKDKLGLTPLDVGADRIARTAHAALKLLSDVRTESPRPIPLAWGPDFSGAAAIEVYPAATLKAHGILAKGYKQRDQRIERAAILEKLGKQIDIGEYRDDALKNPDVLDALVCALAGKDFVEGRAMSPPECELAKKEGWIWTARGS